MGNLCISLVVLQPTWILKYNYFKSIFQNTSSDLSYLKARKECGTGLFFDQLISLFQCLLHAAQLFLGGKKPKSTVF
jgi:hypothetical protein